MDSLIAMNARIDCEDRVAVAGDLSATIIARKSKLHDFNVPPDKVPAMIDELPLLACVAAGAGITVEVRGAEELRVKESDRISVVVENLRAVGATVDEYPDGFKVRGKTQKLAGRITTHGDHRIAMAFGVLGAKAGNSIEIDDTACVAVSYPGFWRDLESVR
jgi:3-phosphoshikimate 1-carboxyvinyltransferase